MVQNWCVLIPSVLTEQDDFEPQICECALNMLYQVVDRFAAEQVGLTEDICVAVGSLATNRKYHFVADLD